MNHNKSHLRDVHILTDISKMQSMRKYLQGEDFYNYSDCHIGLCDKEDMQFVLCLVKEGILMRGLKCLYDCKD